MDITSKRILTIAVTALLILAAFGAIGATAVAEETNSFEIVITDTNAPIDENEDLIVYYTVENTGDNTEEQTIELLNFAGDVVDSENVELDSGDSEYLTLTWATEYGDAGTGDITVQSEDDSDTEEVTIEAIASYYVEITDTNEPIYETQNLDVTATIENPGSADGAEQTIELLNFAGDVVDSENVELDSGDSEYLTLTWATEYGDAGTGDITVQSEDDSDTEEVTISAITNVVADDVKVATAYEDATWYSEDEVSEINAGIDKIEDVDEIEVTVEHTDSEENWTVTLEWNEEDDYVGDFHPEKAGDHEITHVDGVEVSNGETFEVAPYTALSEHEVMWNDDVTLDLEFYKNADGDKLTQSVDWEVLDISSEQIDYGDTATGNDITSFTADSTYGDYLAGHYLIKTQDLEANVFADGYTVLPVIVDIESDAEQEYAYNPAENKPWSGTLLDAEGEPITDYGVTLNHELEGLVESDLTNKDGEWTDQFTPFDAATYNITILMQVFDYTTNEIDDTSGYENISDNIEQLSFNVITNEDALEVDVTPTSALSLIEEKELTLNISNFDDFVGDFGIQDEAKVFYVLEGVAMDVEENNDYTIITNKTTDVDELGIYSEKDDDGYYTTLVLAVDDFDADFNGDVIDPELEFDVTFVDEGTLDVTAYVETQYLDFDATMNVTENKIDLHGVTSIDVFEADDVNAIDEKMEINGIDILDKEIPITVLPTNTIIEDDDRVVSQNGEYNQAEKYEYKFTLVNKTGGDIEFEGTSATLEEVVVEGAGISATYDGYDDELWTENGNEFVLELAPLIEDDLTITMKVNVSGDIVELERQFEVKGMSGDITLDGDELDSVNWGDAEELILHLTREDSNINNALVTVSQEWGDDEFLLEFDGTVDTTDAGLYEFELNETIWNNITTGELNISAYLYDKDDNVRLAYYDSVEVEAQDAFDIDVEPSVITTGMEIDYFNITITEDGEPITDLVENADDYDVELELAWEEDLWVPIDEDNIEEINATAGEYQIQLEEYEWNIYNKTGTYGIAVEYAEQKGGTGTFDAELPTVGYTIEAFDKDGELYATFECMDEFIATAEFDKQYNVTVWAEDVHGEAIEGSIILVNSTGDLLNHTFIDDWEDSTDIQSLSLNESGMAEFTFTPEEPVEVMWQVLGLDLEDDEEVLKEIADIFEAVEEPKLVADIPSVEMTELYTGVTSEIVDDKPELDVLYEERNEIRFLIGPADDRDAPLDQKKIVIDTGIEAGTVSGTSSFSDEHDGQTLTLSVTPNVLGDHSSNVYIGDKDDTATKIIDHNEIAGYLNSYEITDVTKELELEIVTDEDDWVEGEDIEFRVTADGEAVEDATVWFNDEEATTDEDGYATLTFEEAGTFTVTAEKDEVTDYDAQEHINYEDDTVEITIEEVPGFTVLLALIALLGAVAALFLRKRTQQS
ncbi:CARDB domain-containing protein [Methanonatronarchaeum sp. AMET-Sl]|uniref:CARDB domain-containing protein n=1 Tax=Methanonatronarchaeum sp. AMET-Sl TaxID=3037654 RepID=UPI00244E59C5|nr:CARDB domain-containing protein [Methanonatronarchaeum sp. AMET-Sl]WGI16883.1 CARDB domain-containing protein [Methanonatronarchaeum sp. AMET-Sl]